MSRSQRLTLIATILGSTVVFLDGTVVNVALPAISDGLGVGLAGQQWVVESYALALVSLLLVGGSLGDQFGRRRIFVIGLLGFGVTSILCAVAPSEEFLIAARALQGITGALLVPGSLAIVASTFEGAARGKAVGTWTAWTGIATVLGPAGGGALIGITSWRAIFWVNIPLIAGTVLLTLHSVEESRDEDAFLGIDWAGIALSAIGLGAPTFALIEQPSRGWEDPLVWASMAIGVLCFGFFILREATARHPMLPLGLFRIRNFWVTNLTTLATYAGLIGGLFFVGLYLQQVVGYSPLEAGLATTPISILMFFLSPRFGRMASGTGPRLPMSAGPILGGLGLLLLMRVDTGAGYVADVLPGLLVFGIGLSATVAPLTATVLDSVDEHRVGIASGVNNGVSRVAGLLAIAVLGAVISASFGARLDDQLGAAPLSGAAVAAVAEAKEKPLAVPETDGVPAAEADKVMAAAEDASTSSFHLGIAIAGVLMILGGIVAALGVQNPRRKVISYPSRGSAQAGECGHGSDADCIEQHQQGQHQQQEKAAAAADPS
ncbi:MAG TPA: MFS transporter [Solirubrobacterales bacterium]|nr:MFS transporter [Solirubrobacterales bacterium]